MFRIQREHILRRSYWQPGHNLLACIEATGGQTGASNGLKVSRSFVEDDHVSAWLRGPDTSTDPESIDNESNITLRLLVCEQPGWHQTVTSFGMSKASFLMVEEAFKLPLEALACFETTRGRHSCRFEYSVDGNKVISLGITIAFAPMFQLGNFSLAMRFDCKTHRTRALLHGSSVIEARNKVTNEESTPHMDSLQFFISHAGPLCSHPLIIPAAMMQDRLRRMSYHQRFDLGQRLHQLEAIMGVTRAGRRLHHSKGLGPEGLIESEIKRAELTMKLSTAITDAIGFINTTKSDGRFIQFMSQNNTRFLQEGLVDASLYREMQAVIDDLSCEYDSITEYQQSLLARLQLQLNVMYSFIAQADSSLSATQAKLSSEVAALNFDVAADAGLDAAAMKALALVTTIFLPSTFVASMFSMSMFDWQAFSLANAGEAAATKVVVPQFWIYWVVSIPLTIGVLVAWRFWWYHQKRKYEKKYTRTWERSSSGLEGKDSA